MKAKIKFVISVIADIPKKDYDRLLKEVEDKISTSLDISTPEEVSYLNESDEYEYIENVECDYTQLIGLEGEE